VTLSKFRPTPEMVQDIKRELTTAGIEWDSIPTEWLEAIAAATFKWIATKPQGLEHTSRLLNLSWEHGRKDTNYQILNVYGIPDEDINPEDIFFFEGCMIKGKLFPKEHVRINEIAKDQCGECGTMTHCIKEVFNHRKDATEPFCNACLIQSEDLRAREHADTQMCVACPDTTCVHNFVHLRGSYDQQY